MTASDELVNTPIHQEWWFRILVTALLAAIVQLWSKYVTDVRDDDEGGDGTNPSTTAPTRGESSSSSAKDERQERLKYSRLIAQEGYAHDLSLKEETVERQRTKEREAKPFDEDEPTVDDADNSTTSLVSNKIVEESTTTVSNQEALSQTAGLSQPTDVATSASGMIQVHRQEALEPTSDPPQPSEVATSASGVTPNDAAESLPDEAPAQPAAPASDAVVETTRDTTAHQPNSRNAFLSNSHPGLDAFWYWWDVNMSLFRIYTVARTDGVDVAPPYNPSSRRGVTPVALKVTNGTKLDLLVYWVDFKGRYVSKGTIKPNRTWYQSTWIDHPWVFCRADNEQPLLYYIPYRVIPTTKQEPTVDPDEPEIGVHRFTIRPPAESSVWCCQVADPVLPFPAKDFFLTPEIAMTWTLLHCHRMSYTMNVDWNALIKYLTNIVQHPDEAKYRKLRLANPNFAPVWNSPLQGLLLAVGFVEHHEYVYLGRQDAELPRERVQELSQLLYHLEQWKNYHENPDGSVPQQPEGADGYGREGYGRAGLNLT